jgi:hypothetical protein
MSDQYVTREEYLVGMLRMMRYVLTALEKAERAEAAARLPEEDRLTAFRAIRERYEEIWRQIDGKPVPDALALLRAFEGSLQ